MKDFLQRFEQQIAGTITQVPRFRCLLAVSGGVDSMSLLHLFHRFSLPFAVAHCNFQLRGKESDEDELFVKQQAEALDSAIYIKRFETEMLAAEEGISLQMAARNLRYQWFQELAKTNPFDFIVTAHNLNDAVETALLNFTRGTGLKGLTGIRSGEMDEPTQGVSILRPLLFASREEILAYAKAENIAWREDSSNVKEVYKRNAIRHSVIPQLEQLNPNFIETAGRNLLRLKETKGNFDFFIHNFFLDFNPINANSGEPLCIELNKLQQLPHPGQILFELLSPLRFTEDQTRQLAQNLGRTGFELHSEDGWKALVDRTYLLVKKLNPSEGPTSEKAEVFLIEKGDLMLRLPDSKPLFFMPSNPAPPYPNGKDSILVDAGRLKYPLLIRHWQNGDSFAPFGLDGQQQKLQDYFTNEKLSKFEKSEVWLLLNGDGKIIWVMGLRMDERFRIGEETKEALKIEWTR